MVETSPAAIVTVDERGFIELANRAASELMAPRDGNLIGTPDCGVPAGTPPCSAVGRSSPVPGNDAMPGPSRKWRIVYGRCLVLHLQGGTTPKLAAIIADVTDETSAADANSAPPTSSERAPLNDRETDVLRFLVQGLANKEIAARMDVSDSTVKNTLQQLFDKTNVRTRAQLVRVALEQFRDLL